MSQTLHSEGSVALVTGAGGGIGQAICQALSDAGHQVVASDLAVVPQERQGNYAPGTVFLATNVVDPASVAATMGEVEQRFGRLDVLVNAAGALKPSKIEQITEAEWDLIVDVNLKGTFLCTQAALALMRPRQFGRIINLSSTAGKNISTAGGAHYTAAKAGVLGLTRHAAYEFGKDGITVNAVCPGLIDTVMVRDAMSEAAINAAIDSFPIQRIGTPLDVAELITFLASEQAGYITGASVDINGGDLMI